MNLRYLIPSLTAILLLNCAQAARISSAEITRTINDVRLLLSGGIAREASEGNQLRRGSELLTGKKSRAELTLPDNSIIRLGQNTSFSFLEGKRELGLKQGTILLQQPKWKGRTEIRTAAISAAITGTTIMVETSPEAGIVKLLVLEGALRFSLNASPNKVIKLKAGEMVAMPTNAEELPRVLVFDIAQLRETSQLLQGGFPELPNMSKIDDSINTQSKLKSKARLIELNVDGPQNPRQQVENQDSPRNQTRRAGLIRTSFKHFGKSPNSAGDRRIRRDRAQDARNRQPAPPQMSNVPPRKEKRPPATQTPPTINRPPVEKSPALENRLIPPGEGGQIFKAIENPEN
ncbi:MAG: hypothetical protein GY899_15245 [Verrucomicrobiaceae bacterium]|nr:hypothetical protein [Verrucomicrobiaceae bacterium]